MNESVYDELKRLRSENARLRALLASHGIAADEPKPSIPQKPSLSQTKVYLLSLRPRASSTQRIFNDHSIPTSHQRNEA